MMLLRALLGKEVMDIFHYTLIFHLQAIDEFKILYIYRTIHYKPNNKCPQV